MTERTTSARWLERFLDWARSQPDIRAVALVGSTARTDYPADEWSDLDLVVVASDPQPYLRSADWLEPIEKTQISTVERTAKGHIVERRVLFESGLDVDLIVLSREDAAHALQAAPLADIARRGMRVLIDRENVFRPPIGPREAKPAVCPPTEAEFAEVVDDFWFHAVWTAKKLMRGELWVAKSCCDTYAKRLLLRMIEWHTRATQGWNVNTWYNGRFLERWALPWVVEGLRGAFAHYDDEDVWRALGATMDLFRRVARETAKQLAYSYPASADQSATTWVRRLQHSRPTQTYGL